MKGLGQSRPLTQRPSSQTRVGGESNLVFQLEDVRIVVTKQQYYEEGNASTYPREENIVVKADPNANPQYEPLYMYAVLKATKLLAPLPFGFDAATIIT